MTSLIETPFGGRYCGKIPPRPKISLYRALSFVFLSDRDDVTEARFSGGYRFIPNGECACRETFSIGSSARDLNVILVAALRFNLKEGQRASDLDDAKCCLRQKGTELFRVEYH